MEKYSLWLWKKYSLWLWKSLENSGNFFSYFVVTRLTHTDVCMLFLKQFRTRHKGAEREVSPRKMSKFGKFHIY